MVEVLEVVLDLQLLVLEQLTLVAVVVAVEMALEVLLVDQAVQV